ncbi:thioredoxin-like negative regulator of GroEL [Inhella inkyongensis]|uniref:Thioredoxin-like negative regulator of GroEL n=1 Tax=Inhella inkyongensis TaxID=392593 RepID=A0A840SC23_9BURK|nr:thioredoxin family protein [Inhella inkyongensis]MBB5206314.1 thioredoxin-like negative regulator of GroEL [Inhella inkyongensis]
MSAVLDLYCLCAEWCGTCREVRPTLEGLAAADAGLRLQWVDIEDEAERVGDLDIETFPTLLLAQGEQVLFFGPSLPQEAALRQLVLRAQEGRALQGAEPQAQALLQRLRG